MTINDVLVAVVFSASVPANAFPILYTWWKNWWWQEVPRHLTLLVTGIAALIDLAIVRRVWGEFGWYDEVCLVVYLLIAYQLYRRLWLLIKYNSPWGERREDRRERLEAGKIALTSPTEESP